jgi:hypothetical protein
MKILYLNKVTTGLLIIFLQQMVYGQIPNCNELKIIHKQKLNNLLIKKDSNNVPCATKYGEETDKRKQECAEVRASQQTAWDNWSSNCQENYNED